MNKTRDREALEEALERLRVAHNEQREQLIGLLREIHADLVSLVVMLRNEMTGDLEHGLRLLNCKKRINALVGRVRTIEEWLSRSSPPAPPATSERRQ